MLSILNSGTTLGTEGLLITVEVDSGAGLGSHNIVGLPDTAVRESLDRIESAIKNSEFNFLFHKKFTVNLAPANIRKEGCYFDLPIAIGLLAADGHCAIESLKDYLVIGELSLSGELKPAKGILPIAIKARELGLKNIILPYENRKEGSLVKELNIYPAKTLSEAIAILKQTTKFKPFKAKNPWECHKNETILDLADVKGQHFAKRALEIAAAGGHNVLLVGSPGCGKTMMARRFPYILPNLSFEEAIEVSRIYSISGMLNKGLIKDRPFRSPHHTISNAGLVGGGTTPKPGEITLSHRGVLFLDELPEFNKNVLEMLRQPIEDEIVTISRAQISLTYPASFILLAAMNPCPCGHYLDPQRDCTCSPVRMDQYRRRISGPLLDRMDIIIEVPTLTQQELISKKAGESSTDIRKRVEIARKRQYNRQKTVNAKIPAANIRKQTNLDQEAQKILANACNTFNFSGRAYDKLLKTSLTISDLDLSEKIKARHISEALQLRSNFFK